jgi:hypothetical protein
VSFRKEIDELVSLYSLEPELNDVYVEGVNDKGFIEWFLAEKGEKRIEVYCIDGISIPPEVLAKHDLGAGGNRSRVIALSEELAERLPSNSRILCIADRDNEDFVSCGKENRYLGFTDYTSIELYLLQRKTLRKLFLLVLGGMPVSAGDLLREITDILSEVFLIRLTNFVLGWNMEWVPFIKYTNVVNGITFAEDRFINAYLKKNKKWERRKEFEEKRKELRLELDEDPRSRVRGHDLMELMHKVVKRAKPRCKFADVAFCGAFLGCLEIQDVVEEPMFQRLVELSSSNADV